MKIYTVDFKPIYSVGGCLVIAATNYEEAYKIASKTILHTTEFSVNELILNEPEVIIYLSGDY